MFKLSLVFILLSCFSSLVFCERPAHTKVHELQSDHKMIKVKRSDPIHEHSLIFAIRQNNIDKLEQQVNDLADPFSPNYRKWLSPEDVHAMTVNEAGYNHVIDWLNANNIPTESTTSYTNYITATAPIKIWEKLLDIKFYEWNHFDADSEVPITVHRSEELKLPNGMVDHVATVFNTCQAMPVISQKPQRESAADGRSLSKTHVIVGDVSTHLRSRLRRQLTAPVNVEIQYLHDYYQIPILSDLGSAGLTQSVFTHCT